MAIPANVTILNNVLLFLNFGTAVIYQIFNWTADQWVAFIGLLNAVNIAVYSFLTIVDIINSQSSVTA